MPECLPPIIELYRLQQDANGRALCPHIVIVDTGSTYENMQLLEGLRAPDVEIHYVRSHSYPHSSGPVAVACDLAVALCQTRWLFMTHCDAFPVRRDLLADLRARCEEGDYIVAGYRMSDRSFVHDGPDTEGVPGHMCTLWDVHAIWDYGISFSISRCYRDMGIDTDMHSRIDTETLPGRLLNRYGLTHRFLQLGIETNNERQVTDYIDHRRSLVGMKIYAFERYAACLQSLADAIGTAWDRVWRWKSAKAGVTEADK
jgi:hypothetical protein